MHFGTVDSYNFPKRGKLGSIIFVSGGLRSRYPLFNMETSVSGKLVLSLKIIGPCKQWNTSRAKKLSDFLSCLSFVLFSNLVDCPPKRSVKRQIKKISVNAPHTRKSLVKGERFIRYVWKAEKMTVTKQL